MRGENEKHVDPRRGKVDWLVEGTIPGTDGDVSVRGENEARSPRTQKGKKKVLCR